MSIAIVDVHYDDNADVAGVAAIVAAHWQAELPSATYTRLHHGLNEYQPGYFFERELPCVLPLLQEIMSTTPLTAIIIDGYVDLNTGRPGLGRHLSRALDQSVEVVGIAKNPFSGTDAIPIQRGTSQRALFISSCTDSSVAALRVGTMHGDSRLPTLVKLADSSARKLLA